ncbi:non-hydrolyzing UDP-N-acetylglucosamine 2-epimerase [Halanaerobaculum tunisiense]
MEQLTVLSIFGTRPEAIKLAPVIKALEAEEQIQSVVAVTGQHQAMLDQVVELFSLQPNYNLQIMQPGQSLAQITAAILTDLDPILAAEDPDLVLVHGDTSTTFVSALTSFYHQLPIGHIEAGLRSGAKYSPYPEEINRRLTSSLADLHFAPTRANRSNLLAEGVVDSQIFVTGNTVLDALELIVDEDYSFQAPELQELDFSQPVILVTAHRRENLGQPLEEICQAIRDIADLASEVEIVWPVHLNPEVQTTVYDQLAAVEQVHLLEPLPYQEFINLLARSYLVVTDSGGLQEEAPGLDKPVLVLRETTERTEALQAGTIKLVGTKRRQIRREISNLLVNQDVYQEMAKQQNPYGAGQASERIVAAILDYYDLSHEL